MDNQTDIAGLNINTFSKKEFLAALEENLKTQDKIFITTLYSEFLHASLHSKEVTTMLNKATFALPDGIGILWAKTFLDKKLTLKSFYGKIIQGLWQIAYTGAGIILNPKTVKTIFPETIVGADLFWDLCAIANKENYSVYLLGGYSNVSETTAKKLKEKFPGLKIVGTSNKDAADPSVVKDILQANPDFLFVAFGPLKQEKWITEHLERLPIKLAIGLGGTFDYIAGTKKQPPQFVRKMGVEWFYRLLTQPYRFTRIWTATWKLCSSLLRYKVYMCYPYRKNVVPIVFNKRGELLLCHRIPRLAPGFPKSVEDRYNNHWQFPQGGVNEHEDIIEAAKRELWEETGIESVNYLTVSDHTNAYLWPNAGRSLWTRHQLYKGQEQVIVYFEFTGEEKEIKVDNVEFSEYKWVSENELLSTLHDYRKSVGDIVLQDLKDNQTLKKGLNSGTL